MNNLIFFLLLNTSVHLQAQTNEKEPILEFVLYHLTDSAMDQKGMIKKYVLDDIGRMPGFQGASFYESFDDPTIILELVVWNSLDEALSAAERVFGDPYFQPLLATNDSFIVYDHFLIQESIKTKNKASQYLYVELSDQGMMQWTKYRPSKITQQKVFKAHKNPSLYLLKLGIDDLNEFRAPQTYHAYFRSLFTSF